ncbi:hypothetical protein ACP4OV_016621 [Aristida adscensionis]
MELLIRVSSLQQGVGALLDAPAGHRHKVVVERLEVRHARAMASLLRHRRRRFALVSRRRRLRALCRADGVLALLEVAVLPEFASSSSSRTYDLSSGEELFRYAVTLKRLANSVGGSFRIHVHELCLSIAMLVGPFSDEDAVDSPGPVTMHLANRALVSVSGLRSGRVTISGSA